MNPADTPLKVASFTMFDTWNRPLTVSEDGKISGHQGLWGHVRPDGSVTFPDGSLRGSLLDDGRVVAEDVHLATIHADASATVDDIQVHFNEEGNLVGGDPSQSIRLAPRNADTVRIAMLIFILSQLRPRPKRA